MMHNLWDPFLSHIVERSWRVDIKANKEDIGLWIGEWPQSVIVFLGVESVSVSTYGNRSLELLRSSYTSSLHYFLSDKSPGQQYPRGQG